MFDLRFDLRDLVLDATSDGTVIITPEGEVSFDDVVENARGSTAIRNATASHSQSSGNRCTRAEGFDACAPMGSWCGLVCRGVRAPSYLNGDVRQDSSTDKLVFGIPDLITYTLRIMARKPGEDLAPGTPPSVASCMSEIG